MGLTKIVISFILLLVDDGRRKFVSTVPATSPSTSQNQEAKSMESDHLVAFETQVAGHDPVIGDGKGTSMESDHLVAFEMQVAGHDPAIGSGKGIFRDADGNLLKGGFIEQEQKFYENLEITDDPLLKELRDYVPRYCGIKNVKAKNEDKEYPYLCVEDQTRGLTLANLMDVKIGEQFWEPGDSEEKIEKRKWKFAPMRGHYGFCIPGTKFHDIDTEILKEYGRPFTHTMTPKQAIQVIYEFINRQSGLELGLVDNILVELRKIYSWFKRQRHYKFYGSSILIVYDTANLKKKDSKVRVRMIDFGHAVPNAENDREEDQNYLRGLKSLIGLLENLDVAVRKYTNILDQPGASYRNPIMNDDEQEKSMHVSLPPGWQPFDQIAGRVINKGGKKLDKARNFVADVCENPKFISSLKEEATHDLGFLKDLQGNLGKPDPHQEEIDFYETLSTTKDPILVELKQYVPEYFGMKTMEIEKETIRFIHIENMLKDFEIPCRVDVKMGIKRRPYWAPPKPAERLYKYKAMLATWRFAIPGFECYSVPMQADAKPEKKSRKYTHHMLPSEGVTTLYEFVNGDWGIKCGLVHTILDELRKIESWFERQRHYRFYDSSVFVTYDAKRLDDFAKGLITESDCRSLKMPLKVRMIDFGNTFKETEDEPDENYLEALRNLMWIFQNLAENNFKPNLLPKGHQQT